MLSCLLESGGKEIEQRVAGGVGVFLGEEMAGVNRLAGGPRCPLPPDLEWAAGFVGNPGRAPQRQQRAGDGFSGGAVGLVVFEVGVAAGAVVLAMGMDPQRIGKRHTVMVKSARV